jgi:hypothetical protein
MDSVCDGIRLRIVLAKKDIHLMLYAAAVSQRPIFYWKHGAHLPGQMLSVEAEV